MKQSFDGRKFQFWYYRVSHGELLIRSPANCGNSTNIDIIFFDVQYVDLPRCLPNLELVETEKRDMEHLRKKVKINEQSKITVLLSDENRYYVVSSIVKIAENEMDMFELPFEKLWEK